MVVKNLAGNREVRSGMTSKPMPSAFPTARPFGLIFDSTFYPELITTWLLKNGIQRFYHYPRPDNLPTYTLEYDVLNYHVFGILWFIELQGGEFFNYGFRSQPYYVVDV
jgi:hypothetical protein